MPALALVRLELMQFRSHARSSLDLDGAPGPVVLFGPNGAGKTNLLEAVSLLSPGRGLRRAAAPDCARHPAGLGWKLRATLARGPALHEIETAWTPGQPGRQVLIDARPAPQVALGRLGRVLWLVPAMDRLWTEAAEGRRRFLDRLALGFAPAHAEDVLSYEKALRERNRLLRDGVRDPAWHGALEARMAEAGARITATRQATLARLGAAQGGGGAFPVAALALSGPEGPPIDDAPALAQALAQGRRADLAAGRSLTGPHRDDLGAVYLAKGMAARDCSTGEQKALLLSLVLAAARSLAAEDGLPPILLLDEVAAHLDADRRAALYEDILSIGAQAWLTGTEAGLFDTLSGRATLIALGGDGVIVKGPS